MTGRALWLVGASLVAWSAQAQTGPASGGAAPNAEVTDTGEIGEIIVTATRRAERLQDVPIAITAITGETLADRAIFDVTRLAEISPGLNIGRSGSDVRPAIRGINTEAIGANSDPRIAFYIDDIYLSRTSQALAGFLDLDRVEVQRGPQGTLFGRNSFGGNIVLYSNTPRERMEAGASLLYGEFNRFRAEGYVNVPINDSVQARVAAYRESMDGYVKNSVTGGSDLGDEDSWFVRGSLRIAPPGSGLEIVLRASYWDQGGDGISAFGYKSLGTPVNPSLVRAPGQTFQVGNRTVTAPLNGANGRGGGFNGSDAFGVNSFSNSRFRDNVVDFTGTNGVGVDIGVPIERSAYRINFDANTVRDTQFTLLSAHLTYDFGPITFRSITGYSDFFARRSSDNDFSSFPVAIDFNQTSTDTFSQEIQLLSSSNSSPFQWIVGGFYYDDRIREIFFSDNNLAFAPQGLNAPLFNGGGLGLTTANNISATRSDAYGPVQVYTKSYAGFAQASYTFFEKLRFTGGLRFTSDAKKYNAGVQLAAPPQGLQFQLGQPIDYSTCGGISGAAGNGVANAIRIQCGRDTFEQVTYRAAVDYKVTDRNLLYFSFSTGFRSGGFNNVLSDPSNVNSPVISFAPEKVQAFEAGTKNQFFDNKLQLNVAAFYNDFDGLQVQRQVPAPNGLTTFSIIENSGKGRSYGVEVEAVAKPTRQLTLAASYVYLNSRFTKYETGTAANGLGPLLGCPAAPRDYACEAGGFSPNGFAFPNGLSDPDRFRLAFVAPNGAPTYNYVIAGSNGSGRSFGANIPLSPRHVFTVSAAYELDLGDAGTLTPFAQVYYNDGYDNLDLNLPIARQGDYTKTDLRLTWMSRSERYTVQGFVENVEDAEVLNRTAIGANRSINAAYALPRTWGIRAGAKF